MTEILYIIAPCYNEQEVIALAAKELKSNLDELKKSGIVSDDSRILFVDDGSTDNSWEIIYSLCEEIPSSYTGVRLSRNYGHQNALLAGLKEGVKYADLAVTLDIDLQDDLRVLGEMIDSYNHGADIVYGVRKDRSSDTGFKRRSADLYYSLMRALGAQLVYNHGDYRLMSKRGVLALLKFSEASMFLRGLVPLVGYKSEIVTYTRQKRVAGKSKYTLSKMLSFAWQGITALSTRLFKFIIGVGLAALAISVLMFFFALSRTVVSFGGNWILFSIWFLAGLQITFTGIVGEYVSRAFLEAKKRPNYIVDEVIKDGVSNVITEDYIEDFMI